MSHVEHATEDRPTHGMRDEERLKCGNEHSYSLGWADDGLAGTGAICEARQGVSAIPIRAHSHAAPSRTFFAALMPERRLSRRLFNRMSFRIVTLSQIRYGTLALRGDSGRVEKGRIALSLDQGSKIHPRQAVEVVCIFKCLILERDRRWA